MLAEKESESPPKRQAPVLKSESDTKCAPTIKLLSFSPSLSLHLFYMSLFSFLYSSLSLSLSPPFLLKRATLIKPPFLSEPNKEYTVGEIK